jgi:hypothetical protein
MISVTKTAQVEVRRGEKWTNISTCLPFDLLLRIAQLLEPRLFPRRVCLLTRANTGPLSSST